MEGKEHEKIWPPTERRERKIRCYRRNTNGSCEWSSKRLAVVVQTNKLLAFSYAIPGTSTFTTAERIVDSMKQFWGEENQKSEKVTETSSLEMLPKNLEMRTLALI